MTYLSMCHLQSRCVVLVKKCHRECWIYIQINIKAYHEKGPTLTVFVPSSVIKVLTSAAGTWSWILLNIASRVGTSSLSTMPHAMGIPSYVDHTCTHVKPIIFREPHHERTIFKLIWYNHSHKFEHVWVCFVCRVDAYNSLAVLFEYRHLKLCHDN